MGSLLGGGGGGGLLGGGGSGGGGGFLGNLLGGLPDPLGLNKILGITGGQQAAPPGGAPQSPMGPPQPSGVKFAPLPGAPSSGVSFDPRQLGNSPMGPTGFGVGGGGQGQR